MNNNDNDKWETYHSLKSTPASTCSSICSDPICKDLGCLNKPAITFRNMIFDGIRSMRYAKIKKYGLEYMARLSYMDLKNGHNKTCAGCTAQSVCIMHGCLEAVPGYEYRHLIDAGMKYQLIKELKK